MSVIVWLALFLVPPAWGYVWGRLDPATFDTLYMARIVYWELAFALLVFGVGWRFGRTGGKPVMALIGGGLVWLGCLLVFVWEFIVLDGAQRHPGWPTLLPQLYAFGLNRFAGWLIDLLFPSSPIGVNATVTVTVTVYLLILALFAAGFVAGRGGTRGAARPAA